MVNTTIYSRSVFFIAFIVDMAEAIEQKAQESSTKPTIRPSEDFGCSQVPGYYSLSPFYFI